MKNFFSQRSSGITSELILASQISIKFSFTSIFSRETAIGLKSQNFKYKKRKVDFNKKLCYNIYRKNKEDITHMVFGPILDKMAILSKR